jgi:FixJ family two-component response regulator
MTGLELHRHLRQSGYSVPTILITAYSDDRERNQAADQGVICHLSKPIEQGGLLECVRSTLERANPERDPS